ncbi:MAG: ABC transporter substrate-binding protein [Defluviitaleaceae bacterium]|nr:ABC transporter substrate-binding protein [Defluviitaleaceae bacterium]
MKKKLTGIFIASILLSLTISAPMVELGASQPNNTVPIYLNNQRVEFTGQEPVLINGRVLVPLELLEMMGYSINLLFYDDDAAIELFEMMGLDTGWLYDNEFAIWIYHDWTNLIIFVGEQFMVVDNFPIYPDIPHQIVGGELMLPLRAIMEAFIWGGNPPHPSNIEEVRALMLAAGEGMPWWDPESRSVHVWSFIHHHNPWTTNVWEPHVIIGDPNETLESIQERFPTRSPEVGRPPQYGGHLYVGLPSDTPPSGSLNAIFSNLSLDMSLMQWFGGSTSVFSRTAYHTMGQSGIVTWDYCLEGRSLHLVQRADVYWHDGHPLTLSDLVFAHEMIAHPDYLDAGGVRWNTAQQNIVGAWEYHRGEADYISGLVLSEDERELTIYFIDFPPSILHFGFFSSPYPRHIFQDVPLHEQPWHYHSTTRPIGWGPFIVERDAPWDGLYLVANENYWRGRPYLDSVEVLVLPWSLILDFMQEGLLDISTMGTWGYTVMPEPDNFHYLGMVDNFFGTINFNLGYFDEETSRVVPFENPRMGDPRLRRAMAFAINESVITSELYSGLRVPATSILPPLHREFHIPDFIGFDYDPVRAKAYLDEAGFLVGPDGWRTDPEGNEFIIHLVTNNTHDLHFISEHYADSWKAVGLQVYIERQDFFEMQQELIHGTGERDFDVAVLFWGAGLDPNPNSFWGHALFNIPRFMNDEFQQVLDGFNSPQAWDLDWLRNHFHEWQRLFYEYAPAFPANWRINLTAVNNRVMGHDVSGTNEDWGLHRIWVTGDEAYIW